MYSFAQKNRWIAKNKEKKSFEERFCPRASINCHRNEDDRRNNWHDRSNINRIMEAGRRNYSRKQRVKQPRQIVEGQTILQRVDESLEASWALSTEEQSRIVAAEIALR